MTNSSNRSKSPCNVNPWFWHTMMGTGQVQFSSLNETNCPRSACDVLVLFPVQIGPGESGPINEWNYGIGTISLTNPITKFSQLYRRRRAAWYLNGRPGPAGPVWSFATMLLFRRMTKRFRIRPVSSLLMYERATEWPGLGDMSKVAMRFIEAHSATSFNIRGVLLLNIPNVPNARRPCQSLTDHLLLFYSVWSVPVIYRMTGRGWTLWLTTMMMMIKAK